MKRFWFALCIIVFQVTSFFIFPHWWAVLALGGALCVAAHLWWKLQLTQSVVARSAVRGLLICMLTAPFFVQIFEQLWIRITLLLILMIIGILYQYYTLSLVGQIRARSTLLLTLLTLAHGMSIGMVSVIAMSVAGTMVQYVSYWIMSLALWYGLITYQYYRGLSLAHAVIIPSVLLQTVMIGEITWILMMLPFAPLTKTLLGLLPVLYLTYTERDRLLQVLDVKQVRKSGSIVIITLLFLMFLTRWS